MTTAKQGRNLIVIGAGGQGRVVAALAERCGFSVLGFLDRNPEHTSDRWPVLGDDKDLVGFDNVSVALGIGARGLWARRQSLANDLAHQMRVCPTLLDPSAIVLSGIPRETGVQVMPAATIQPEVSLGSWSLVNTGAILEHGCEIGDHVHVAPGAVLCGEVRVGAGAFIGAGAVVREGIRVGKRSTVGAGAVVIRDVPDGATVVGVPAKELT